MHMMTSGTSQAGGVANKIMGIGIDKRCSSGGSILFIPIARGIPGTNTARAFNTK